MFRRLCRLLLIIPKQLPIPFHNDRLQTGSTETNLLLVQRKRHFRLRFITLPYIMAVLHNIKLGDETDRFRLGSHLVIY